MATNSGSILSRRHFLRTALGAVAGASALGALHGCDLQGQTRLIGGFRSPGNRYGVGAIGLDGATRWQLDSPDRVHGPAVDPELGIGAVAARRPGDFIQVFAADSGTLLEQIRRPADMFFEGHVEFAANRLWATAARQDSCRALLLSWDLSRLSVAPEVLELPGIGPHQVVHNAGALWLAVGGWQTRDRVVTNADHFESFLLEIDPQTGQISNRGNPAPGLSLRHLGVRGSEIYAGMQYVQPRPSNQALVYRYTQGSWSALAAPAGGWEVFKGYIASVAANATEIMATSPQGNYLGLWRRDNLMPIAAEPVLDVSGAIAAGEQLQASSGVGIMLNGGDLSQRVQTAFHWDNHWISYTPT